LVLLEILQAILVLNVRRFRLLDHFDLLGEGLLQDLEVLELGGGVVGAGLSQRL